MIREATIDDVLTIAEMAPKFHKDALENLGLRHNPSHFLRYIIFLIENPITTVFVALKGDKIIGTGAALLSPWFMDNSQMIVTEQWVWIDPESRGEGLFDLIMETIISWGKDRGANLIDMIAIGSSTEEQVRDFYESRGFKWSESHFIKEI